MKNNQKKVFLGDFVDVDMQKCYHSPTLYFSLLSLSMLILWPTYVFRLQAHNPLVNLVWPWTVDKY